jgi:hypothetical protein
MVGPRRARHGVVTWGGDAAKEDGCVTTQSRSDTGREGITTATGPRCCGRRGALVPSESRSFRPSGPPPSVGTT